MNEITLRLFFKNVIAVFKPNTDSYDLFGQGLIGNLVARNLEMGTVISIIIKKDKNEFSIPTNDLEELILM